MKKDKSIAILSVVILILVFGFIYIDGRVQGNEIVNPSECTTQACRDCVNKATICIQDTTIGRWYIKGYGYANGICAVANTYKEDCKTEGCSIVSGVAKCGGSSTTVKCDDGTEAGKCSATKKGYMCQKEEPSSTTAQYYAHCDLCGCKTGFTCDTTSNYCKDVQCTDFGAYCSGDNIILYECGKTSTAATCSGECDDGGDSSTYTTKPTTTQLKAEFCGTTPDICTPGEKECVDNYKLKVCSSDGSKWNDETCTSGKKCVDGNCVDINLCEGKDCNDDNLCTEDKCEAGDCKNTLKPCGTGTYCDTVDGICKALPGCSATAPCNDNNECTKDTCGSDGKCIFQTLGDDCTNNCEKWETLEDGKCSLNWTYIWENWKIAIISSIAAIVIVTVALIIKKNKNQGLGGF
jgi:hypothetical protein